MIRPMTYRVIQWSTGNVGRLALRLEYGAVDEILEQGLHPWLTGFLEDSARLSLDIQQAYFEAQ